MKMKLALPVLCTCLLTSILYARQTDESTGKVIVDNAKMKVTEYDSKPGEGVCGKGKHSHPAHLTVLLTDAEVTVTLPDGKTVQQKAPAGAAFWSEAETHTVLNNGKKPVKAYLIETKN